VSPALDLALGEPRFRPGDWVRGKVTVVEGGASRALKVSLLFRERTEDYSATARTEGGASVHSGELAAGGSFDFEVQLPSDALPGYRSANGELYWEVEVKSDEAGFDTTIERRIEVTTV
jgi:hypothetical protein